MVVLELQDLFEIGRLRDAQGALFSHRTNFPPPQRRVAPRIEMDIIAGAGHDFFTVRAKALAERLVRWMNAEGA